MPTVHARPERWIVKLHQSLSITQIEDAKEEDQRNLNQVQPNPSSSELGEIVHAQGKEVLMISINLKIVEIDSKICCVICLFLV